MNEKETKYVESTLKSYSDKPLTKLDELKNLDKEAKRGPRVFAYVFGSIGSLIMGFGMCIAMGVILSEFIALGILIGLVGMAMVGFNYSIYKSSLEKNKKKYSERIKALSKELLNK